MNASRVTGYRPTPEESFTKVILFVLATMLPSLASAAPPLVAETARPNFIVVVADDLGFGDLACYGHTVIQSPNLDRFASEGLKLTSCYAAAACCSPARAALLTGRTPTRAGIHDAIPMTSTMHLRREEVTIATLLRRAGYSTAMIGKWHLNGQFNDPSQPQPNDHGFDYWFATQNVALPNHRNPTNFIRNGKEVGELKGFSAEILADDAIRWLGEDRDKAKPFFLYLCFHEPHEPIATDQRFIDLYAFPDQPSRAAHHGNITQLDESFGRLMHALDAQHLSDNTLVFFTSDNGPALTAMHPHGSAGPLRAKKAHLYEGGIRVPGLARWPGRIKPGTVSDEPVSGVDILPTLCAIAGLAPPNDRAIDGADFLPLLEGQPVARGTPLFWLYHRAQSPPKVAMRIGDWKILARLNTSRPPSPPSITEEGQRVFKTAELAGCELYNLREDIAETRDLAAQEPQRLKTLTAALEQLYHQARDDSPIWPAWEFTNYDSQRIRWPPYYQPAQEKRK